MTNKEARVLSLGAPASLELGGNRSSDESLLLLTLQALRKQLLGPLGGLKVVL
jgi:hypothetical protein